MNNQPTMYYKDVKDICFSTVLSYVLNQLYQLNLTLMCCIILIMFNKDCFVNYYFNFLLLC